jgi:hypothetical protein
MATEKIHELCEDFLFYLLDTNDETHIIMTKIYEEDWQDEDECELWVNETLLNYFGNGLDYLDLNENKFISGCDIRNWQEEKDTERKIRELISEISKEEHLTEIDELHNSLRFWRIESNGFYTSIIFNYCYRLVYDRTYIDLIEFVKSLYESRNIMPK